MITIAASALNCCDVTEQEACCDATATDGCRCTVCDCAVG
jgi:hypothetical protein